MTAEWLLREHPAGLSEQRVREELAGNLCRCTGYDGIVRAVLAVSETAG
jgi:carbon-monoxide dehydrogenase small subunit